MKNLSHSLRYVLLVIYLTICFSSECFSQSVHDSHKKVKKVENEKVTVLGQALDAKGGAVILTKEEKIIYIDGLDYWPDDCVGKTVNVTGFLEQSNAIPNAGASTDKLVRQGVEGEAYIFKNTKWTVLE